jgi:hypothetical protein
MQAGKRLVSRVQSQRGKEAKRQRGKEPERQRGKEAGNCVSRVVHRQHGAATVPAKAEAGQRELNVGPDD